jgi:hypothetical protein
MQTNAREDVAHVVRGLSRGVARGIGRDNCKVCHWQELVALFDAGGCSELQVLTLRQPLWSDPPVR